ncbi:MAG: hypothetical protein KDA29_04625 [Phycisphaerales bacterium]|nr:hypothetical protein [Phycisphaerales bacterium]
MNTTTLMLLTAGVALMIGCIAALHWMMRWAAKAEQFHTPGSATSEDDREASGNNRSPAAMKNPAEVEQRKSA